MLASLIMARPHGSQLLTATIVLTFPNPVSIIISLSDTTRDIYGAT